MQNGRLWGSFGQRYRNVCAGEAAPALSSLSISMSLQWVVRHQNRSRCLQSTSLYVCQHWKPASSCCNNPSVAVKKMISTVNTMGLKMVIDSSWLIFFKLIISRMCASRAIWQISSLSFYLTSLKRIQRFSKSTPTFSKITISPYE